ncbi:MAG: MATE family efflux transporter [Clostridia bacterium]|nr:MATE family efflux transporter [Clostridia bacterium]
MKIQLSDHFTYRRLIRFVLPSIVMMIFTSVYGVVDGLFVSNFVGKTSFAAVNFIMPVIMALGGVGFMIGTGGSAIVGQLLGEGRTEKARRTFSLMIYATVTLGVLLTLIGLLILRPVAVLLGAEGKMLSECVAYGRILLIGTAAFMLQNVFQSFLVTAERPELGLWFTVAASLTNILLDGLFVGVLPWGVQGAALATILSYFVGGVVPLLYFVVSKRGNLYLTSCKIDWRALGKAFTNGSSELLTNLSMSLVNILYNFQLLRLAGEDGVSAYGVIMYVNFIFVSFFIGYSVGTAPVVSYHYGAGHSDELKNLRKKSLRLITGFGVVMLIASEALAWLLTKLFVGYDAALFDLTLRGFMLYSLSFAVCGFNIFGSSFFTALGNGGVSAAISFLRTLVFQLAVLLLLPIWLGTDGIWLAIVASECLALAVTVFFLVTKRKRYGY